MRKLLCLLLLFTLPAIAAGQTPIAKQSPVDVVRQTTNDILNKITTKRELFQKNPAQLYQLVEQELLPTFDFDFTARLVLGRYWRTATPEQQQAFQKAFYQFLTKTYANGLLQYDNEKVEIEELRGEPDPRHTFVRTTLYTSDGTPIPVDYVLHKTAEGWKVFDVLIEGISYVTNYRNAFGQEIRETSLDSLIARLQKQAADAEAKAKANADTDE